MGLKLGSPVTNAFSIGTAELRLGPMTDAARLPQARSVGLVDEVKVSFTTASVDLKGLFPQVVVDSAVTEQTGTATATLREFSRRNLNIMLGNQVDAVEPTDTKTTLVKTVDVAANATAIKVAASTGFAVDDVIVIYPNDKPEDVTISQISAITGTDWTLKAGMGTLVAYPALADSTRDYVVFKANAVAAGAITKTNYFSAMIISQRNADGRPTVWSLWKVSNSGSMEEGNQATDYASLSMELKILQPSASDVKVGGPLATVAPLVSLYPLGARLAGADV